MARMARLVVSQHPHHVTQWGNRCQRVFFADDDRRAYPCLVGDARWAARNAVIAYCLCA